MGQSMRDIDIRRALRAEMDRRHRSDPETRIIEELGLCQGVARVDLATVNGTIHGYEIKSERDTLARLPGQINVYSTALDFVTIIAASTHLSRITDIVPSWWGVWSVAQHKGGFRLIMSRKARSNPQVDPFALAQLLWRDEALEVLADYGLASGARGKPRSFLWQRLASNLTLEQLGNVVRTRLKGRGPHWRSLAPQQ
jgi:hypothetical protein